MTSKQQDMEQKLELLRVGYAQNLGSRVAKIAEAVATLGDQGLESDWTMDLKFILAETHKLAGSGATFGFPRITEIARAMTNDCKAMLNGNYEKGAVTLLEFFQESCQGLRDAAVKPHSSVAAESQEITQASHRKSYASVRMKVAVLVESDTGVAAEIRSGMVHFGYDVRCVDHPGKLASELVGNPVDVVVSSLSFNGNTHEALEILSQLHADHVLMSPLVIHTHIDTIVSRLGAVRAGAQAYLVKPVDIADVVNVLDAVCDRSKIEPARVLIVDDDESLARHSEIVLQGAGMKTHVTTDPMTVLQTLSDFSPELILLDLYMPECSGLEIAAVIRQNRGYAGIPIVFLSGEVDMDKQLSAMELGGDDFLTKPIRPAHLIAAVRIRVARFRELRSFMVRDSMTGLFNHTTTQQLLVTEIARAQRSGHKLALATLDIDHFKNVNDTYGHAVGDQVIKALARLLRQRLRGADVIGRMGGEEFAAALLEIGIEEAQSVCEEIRQDFSAMIFHGKGGEEFSVTFSVGLAVFPQYKTSTSLLNASDKALYIAKDSGRNQVIIAE